MIHNVTFIKAIQFLKRSQGAYKPGVVSFNPRCFLCTNFSFLFETSIKTGVETNKQGRKRFIFSPNSFNNINSGCSSSSSSSSNVSRVYNFSSTRRNTTTTNTTTTTTATVYPQNDDTNKRDSLKIGKHFREMFHDGSETNFESHPFNRRFGHSKKGLFPIEPKNLRTLGLNRQRKKKRGRGDKCPGKGIRDKHKHRKSGKPNSRTFEGGRTPLYRRLPKWPEAWLSRQKKKFDFLNLSKLRYFIEKGRLDTRFPITQRHLHDSKCVKVKNGVKLFNVNDYPFPYKIDIEVLHADQSSIDAITKVGGTVTIVYMERINLRAHVKPYKFEILPKTARPNLDMIHFLEKMRSKGCIVKYIKPLWLIEEEKRIINDMMEIEENAKLSEAEETHNIHYDIINNRTASTTPNSEKLTNAETKQETEKGDNEDEDEDEYEGEDEDEHRNRLLQQYRLQYTHIQKQKITK